MDRATFRRDRYLRSSGYHLAIWSLAAFALQYRLGLQPSGQGLSAFPFFVMLVGGSLMTSFTHERRVGKMAGVAGEPVFAGAGRLWTMVFAALALVDSALVAAGLEIYLVPSWWLGVGAGFAVWGFRAGFGWYTGFGAALASAGMLDLIVLQTDPSGIAAGLHRVIWRSLVLAVAIPAFALETNRRHLWYRRPRP